MLVLSYSIFPIIRGIDDFVVFKIKKSNINEKKKDGLRKFFAIFIVICYAFVFWGFWYLSDLLNKLEFGAYIKVIIYTLILAMLSSSSLYYSPSIEVDSAWKAFKKGLTKANVNNFFAHLPLNIIINLFYLTCLIIAQVEDLKYCKLPEEWSHFFTLNKYGIVIVLAVQKVISGFSTDIARAKIMTEAFVEKEKEDDEWSKELKALRTARRNQRRQKREERKKTKDNK